MTALSIGSPLHRFVDALRQAMAVLFSQTFSVPWTVELKTEESSQPVEGLLSSFKLAVSGGLQGSATVLLKNSDLLSLAQKLRKEEAGAAPEAGDDHKKAIEDLLRQVAAAAAGGLKNDFGEIQLEVSIIDEPPAGQTKVVLSAAENPAAPVMLELRLDEELVSRLAAFEARMAASGKGAAADSNMDLLLGVNLSLTLRFGQRVLTLREILDLNSGSVVELDQQVQEPADLLLGDKLIARGEVVVVDGNYGLRITEVTDARQRIDRV